MKGRTVARTIRPSWSTESFELVELYDEATAKSVVPNDTSFVARGEIERGETDTFAAKSQVAQVVTVIVVPEKRLDNIDVALRTPEGRVLARSTSTGYINWIQIPAPRGGRFEIDVSLQSSGHFLSNSYRLYVVGSGSRFLETDIEGAHKQRL